MNEVPENFIRHFRTSPVTDPWEPLYSRRLPEAVELGLTIAETHCNSRGMLHGGVIAALADNTMGLSVAAAAESRGREAPRLVTTNLSVDYVGAAKLNQWLCIRPRVIKLGRRMSFADAVITADDAVIARANATFLAAV